MLFEFDVSIKTTHTVNAKKRYYCKLTHGVIHYLSIYFPPGCANLVHVTLNRGAHQMFPLNRDGSIKGDAINVEGKEFYPIITAPYEVVIDGWSDGTSYDHIITVRIWMLKPWQLMPFSDEMFNLALQESAG